MSIFNPNRTEEDVVNGGFYSRLTDNFLSRFDSDSKKGKIYELKRRWDEKDQSEFDQIPVEKLINDPYYLGLGARGCLLCGETGRIHGYECADCEGRGEVKASLFKTHMDDILELMKRRKDQHVQLAIFQEGIGSGKTFKAGVILFLLTCEVITKVHPMRYYGLSPKSAGISFVCMSRNARLAKDVTFQQILPFFQCPFFEEHFPPQVDFSRVEETKRYPSVLRFPKNIVIFPGTGSALSAIGFNLFGGIVDETNYLEVIDDSRKVADYGRYDAASEMATAITARMKSRFEPQRLRRQNKIPGVLVMTSNPRYANDYTERMGIKSRTDPSIFYRKRCTWESRDKSDFLGSYFKYDVFSRHIVVTEEKNEPALFGPDAVCTNGTPEKVNN